MKRGGIVPEGYWTLVQGFAFCLETKTFGGRTERYIVVGLDAGRGKPLRVHERAWLSRLRSEGVYGRRSKPRPCRWLAYMPRSLFVLRGGFVGDWLGS